MLDLISLTLAQNDGAAGAGIGMLILQLAIFIAMIAGMWAVFTKAGQPGWGAIIPIFNVYCLMKVAGRPGWWLILMFIPIVSLVIWIIVSIDIAKAFGKSAGLGIVIALFPFVALPILGFTDAQYVGAPAEG